MTGEEGAILSARRTVLLSGTCSALLVLAQLGAGCVPDVDGDGVADAVDDCVLARDPSQLDADHDGFGNACDGDFNQDGVVNFADLAQMKAMFSTSDRVTDLDGDGSVDDLDLAILKSLFYQAPGPSAQGDAENLYVAAGAGANGDGSFANPYRRITDAVVRARADRASLALPPETAIRIHVAAGTYIGSYDAAALQSHPEYEVLPIVVNVPDLMVFGSTALILDGLGLPTGSEVDGRTTLRPDTSLQANQALFLLGRTADGTAGDGATVEGFVLDGVVTHFGSQAVWADRVQNFRIRKNVVRRTGFGTQTRLASGAIEGNLLAGNEESGATASGGSLADPAAVSIRGNRVRGNGQHGIMLLVTASAWPIDLGRNELDIEPPQTSFDRTDSADVPNIPDRLDATVTGNEFSFATVFGIRFLAFIPIPAGGVVDCSRPVGYETLDPAQPLTAVLTARVVGNTFANNRLYGIGTELGFPCRSDPRQLVFTSTASFEANTFENNRAALFTFTAWGVTTGFDTAATFKFAEDSTYQATDLGGGLAGFDYDNPLADPVSGAVLDDTLEMNGVEQPLGTFITPP
jgi:Dockerin type I domain